MNTEPSLNHLFDGDTVARVALSVTKQARRLVRAGRLREAHDKTKLAEQALRDALDYCIRAADAIKLEAYRQQGMSTDPATLHRQRRDKDFPNESPGCFRKRGGSGDF